MIFLRDDGMTSLLSPIGVYGGTFDPVHHGHLRLAIQALETLNLDHVFWIPTGVPPHRNAPVASALHRVKMLEIAIKNQQGFFIDTADALSTNPTYTVQTLMRLRKHVGADQPLVLLLGADSFLTLPAWIHWQALFSLAHIAVAQRPGTPLEITDSELKAVWEDRRADTDAIRRQPAGAIIEFPLPELDISSTQIRTKMQEGSSVAFLLPETVESYAKRHHLYTLKPSY